MEKIIQDIKDKKLKPIYFLYGDEAFFIDEIAQFAEKNILTEDEKGFNQTIAYGNETDIISIISLAKQFPMGADRQVIIVKEAQHLSRNIDQLESYAANPQPSTVLVFCYKGKTLDKRKKLYKELSKNAELFEAKKLYDNQIPDWIDKKVKQLGNQIEPKAKFILAESVGSDLSRLNNELIKLQMIVGQGNMVTLDQIERNVGISKDYNNFELKEALVNKNLEKAFKIAKYFQQNPKDNPLVVSLSLIYNYFSNLIIAHTLSDKSKAGIARELKINPFFADEYLTGLKNYPLKKVTRTISLLREADVKSKGVGSTGNVSDAEILIELIYKIIVIP